MQEPKVQGPKVRSVFVKLHTSTYAPPHQVTLTCKDSLTDSPLAGEYRDGAWYFVLKVRSDQQDATHAKKSYVTISFQLDQQVPMHGAPLEIDICKDIYHFYEGPITFAGASESKVEHVDSSMTDDLRNADDPHSLLVVFHTTMYAPSHFVTLICQDSLTGSTTYGEYRSGAWYFVPKFLSDKERVEISFRLDHDTAMQGNPLEIDVHSDVQHLDEQAVAFSISDDKKKYIHNIDGLMTEDNDFQRRFIASNLDTTIVYDAIVIGSGMGGGILADELSDRGLNVLVLEGGSLHLPQNIVNMPVPNTLDQIRLAISYTNEPGSDLRRDMCMNFGGRSVYWSALIPRMNSWEMQKWPQAVQDYLQAGGYDQAERLLRKRTEFTAFEEHMRLKLEAAFPDYYVDHLPRSFHTPWSSLPTQDRKGNLDEVPTGVFSTAALLLNSLSYPGRAGRDNLTINLNHLVTQIKANRSQATGVVCRDLINNCERTYTAKFIILAAGTTESPCIAIRSNLRGNREWMGVGLTDHQTAEQEFLLPLDSPFCSSNDRAKLFLLPKNRSTEQGQFSCEVGLNAKEWEVRYEDENLLEERRADPQPAGKIKFMFGNELNNRNSVKPTLDKSGVYGKHRVNVRPMTARPFAEQARALSSRILDYLGVDKRTLVDKELKYREHADSAHVAGSLRMGQDPAKSVVDPDLRFREYDNLYCCDLSVFPYIPVANPSLTLAALALRLAEHIRERSGCG